MIPLQHAVATDLAPLVQRLADGRRGQRRRRRRRARPAPRSTTVLADSRSNSLIVRAANPARLARSRARSTRLDRPAGAAAPAGNIWVVHLKNADADKLATVLRAAFGGAWPAAARRRQRRHASPARAGRRRRRRAAPARHRRHAPATAPVAASAQPSTGGFIQADPATNSLIITAPEPLYRQLRAVIDQLDSRRAQVYIESLIVEVDADKAADFGFQWQGLLGNRAATRTSVGAGTNFGTGARQHRQPGHAAVGSGATGLASIAVPCPA